LGLEDIKEIVLDKKFAMKPKIFIYGEHKRLLQSMEPRPSEADDIFYKLMMNLNKYLVEKDK
jgi:hypothetical protein